MAILRRFSKQPAGPIEPTTNLDPGFLREFDITENGRNCGQDPNLHALFEAQVISHPDSIALVCDSVELTYDELNRKANQLAHYLKDAGLVANTLVAIHLPGSIELIIGFLAVLKAGGAYIPIDPSYPTSRINFILKDSHAELLLTHSTLVNDARNDMTTICLDLAQENIDQHNVINLDLPIASHDLAYVIYTSGSTGQPKGVLVEHGSIVNATTASFSAFAAEPVKNLLLLLSLAFDGSFAGIYWTLSQGGKLVLPNKQLFLETAHLNALLRAHNISDILCTPTIYRTCVALLNDPEHNLSRIIVGGEICTEQLIEKHSQLFPEVSLITVYGPTEATVWASFMQVYDKKTHRKATKIGIGHAIKNVTLYVLDQSLQICTPGIEGEIYIGGLGIARGYLNQPELTAEHFRADPFSSDVNPSRLYKTGDRGCYSTQGLIEYLGRVDNQIKLLGHRIELEEIEAVLHKHESLPQVVVITQEEDGIPQCLIAYLLNHNSFNPPKQQQYVATLHAYAKETLPHYMLPAIYQFIDEWPLTPNGKIDRHALKTLPGTVENSHSGSSEQIAGFRTQHTHKDLDIQIQAIWAETFHMQQIAKDANFFALGGHSLLAARIVTKIAERLGKAMPMQAFYHAPTVEQFAKIVEQAPPADPKPSMVLDYPHVLPLHELQFIYWVTKFAEPKLRKYNVVERKRLQGSVNKPALDAALQWVLHKQDVFSYHIHHFYPLQTPCTKPSKQFRRWITTSLQHLSDAEAASYLNRRYIDLFYKKFWRVKTPWIAAHLYYLNNDQIELQIGISHLIADEHSITLFFQELTKAYLFITQRATLHNHELPQNYRHYITRQNSLMQRHANTDEAFWKKYLQDTGFFIVPTQYVVTNRDIFAMHIPVSEEFGLKLRQFCAQHHIGLHAVVCAATSLALFQCCSLDQSCVPHKLLISHLKSTRDEPQYDQAMGCFLRMDILKLSLHSQSTLLDLAKQAQQSAYETADFQRAASLVKIASIGKQPKLKNPLATLFVRGVLTLIAKSFPKFQLNQSLINACETLVVADRTQQFFINVNLNNDFLRMPEQLPADDLLGLPKCEIPNYSRPTRVIPYTLDLAFHRNNDQNRPCITIAANLSPSFQKNFGKTLVSIIMNQNNVGDFNQRGSKSWK